MLHTHCISELCTTLNRGKVLRDEFGGRFLPRPPGLVAPGDGFEFFEPFAETAFSNCSILCFEASTEFASLTGGARPPGLSSRIESRHFTHNRFPAAQH